MKKNIKNWLLYAFIIIICFVIFKVVNNKVIEGNGGFGKSGGGNRNFYRGGGSIITPLYLDKSYYS
jgi:hypothetical protein